MYLGIKHCISAVYEYIHGNPSDIIICKFNEYANCLIYTIYIIHIIKTLYSIKHHITYNISLNFKEMKNDFLN